MITPEQFAKLSPYARGYAVYVAGERDDQPHVPNERNPYPAGSREATEWDRGQAQAVLDVQDGEE
jgi:hypothetical protein